MSFEFGQGNVGEKAKLFFPTLNRAENSELELEQKYLNDALQRKRIAQGECC